MNAPWTWGTLAPRQIGQIRDAALAHIEQHGFGVQHQALLARARAPLRRHGAEVLAPLDADGPPQHPHRRVPQWCLFGRCQSRDPEGNQGTRNVRAVGNQGRTR